jgi:hypothetical protein
MQRRGRISLHARLGAFMAACPLTGPRRAGLKGAEKGGQRQQLGRVQPAVPRRYKRLSGCFDALHARITGVLSCRSIGRQARGIRSAVGDAWPSGVPLSLWHYFDTVA